MMILVLLMMVMVMVLLVLAVAVTVTVTMTMMMTMMSVCVIDRLYMKYLICLYVVAKYLYTYVKYIHDILYAEVV